jgi:hypothetical protein
MSDAVTLSPVPDHEYQAPPFISTNAIDLMNDFPRFGKPNDIGYAANSSFMSQVNYVSG